ncbi:DUF413 domain-containing protein [Paraferrimonas sedimenticola]|uniref:Macrodomain Ori protein n=1 Tax=Paraferrimonas sedimenticola TaxID=375674 RepID=A0AA37RY88_9GAMM|nr:DUF413 domain-containing protein [Paraferrimonas sedimenticola]GLP97184.1 hypothetical protein GCM10007895_24910 [Paraferrimonas sedimenticola]
MSEILFRPGEKRFYDDVAFPRGFAKSGNFTLLESELLTNYGDTMRALESGLLAPANAEERQFVKSLKDPKRARSRLERVWLKYITHTRSPKHFYSLNSRATPAAYTLAEQAADSVSEYGYD